MGIRGGEEWEPRGLGAQRRIEMDSSEDRK